MVASMLFSMFFPFTIPLLRYEYPYMTPYDPNVIVNPSNSEPLFGHMPQQTFDSPILYSLIGEIREFGAALGFRVYRVRV